MKFFSHESRFTLNANRDENKIYILEIPDSKKGVFIRPLTDQFKEELIKKVYEREHKGFNTDPNTGL